MDRMIRLKGVSQNNLKNIDVDFPYRKLSIVTGLSGSGKSSLAFETLYAEGQRRYVECLSTYSRQFLEKMPKPLVESVQNIPPSIALEQRNTVLNSRSTVGTQTEVEDYLRVLFARAGETFCIDCGGKVRKVDVETIGEVVFKKLAGGRIYILAPVSARSHSKAGKASVKGAKVKAQKAPSLRTLAALFLEQGYQRLVLIRGKKKPQLLDLRELAPDAEELEGTLDEDTQVFIVIDRLAIPEPGQVASEIAETRSRFLDSAEQASAIGHGQLAILNHETQKVTPFEMRFACVDCGRQHVIPEPELFSFNSPLGACSHCSGFGFTLDLDEALVVPDPSKTLKNGAIDPLSKPSLEDEQTALFRFCERQGISVGKRYRELTKPERELIWKGHPKDKSFTGIEGVFAYLATKRYKLHVRVFIRRYQSQTLCEKCKGSRLGDEARAVKIQGMAISDVLTMPIDELLPWMRSIKWTPKQKVIAADLQSQVFKRLDFLEKVGVGYLTLSRLTKTLSGGEFQRINLAAQLGNGLCGTLYVLDEPSIGLHAADTERLIKVLWSLRDQGNTVVVVEHDVDVLKAADWIVEIGPGSGRVGGSLVAQGSAAEVAKLSHSLSAKTLAEQAAPRLLRAPRPVDPDEKKVIKITGCTENNLKGITAVFPLGRLTVVTGVSGSGKSTLVHKTLYNAVYSTLTGLQPPDDAGAFDKIYGVSWIQEIVLLDQKPIGKSSRSNPATYLKVYDEIRKIYANQVTAMRRGYSPQHFSFNVDGGRCPVCKGEGEIALDMHFMAEIKIPCEECRGKRFKKDILDITYKSKNIDELLNSTIDEAYDLFRDHVVIRKKLSLLREMGLGYLQLGQSATTLSGGESQRLKVAAALDQNVTHRQFYIFDEPTTGLHQEDVKKLVWVLQDLVNAGHTVVTIEHHLDLISQADWVIDLGPGGGKNGGELVAAGPPEYLLDHPDSITGKMLARAGYVVPRRDSPTPSRDLTTL